jgi:hypothetical protein
VVGAEVGSKPSAVSPLWPATPALLIKRCNGRPRSRKRAAPLRTDASDAKSSSKNSTLALFARSRMSLAASSPLGRLRQATKTWAPSFASSSAVARPMPVLAPVTNATESASLFFTGAG